MSWKDLKHLKDVEIGLVVNVDTRDFHFTIDKSKDSKGDEFDYMKELTNNLKGVKKIDYLTIEEVKERLEDWKSKSGGDKKWRCIQDNCPKGQGWFKYVMFLRTEKGFICFDRGNRYRTNNNLNNYLGFDKELLGAH